MHKDAHAKMSVGINDLQACALYFKGNHGNEALCRFYDQTQQRWEIQLSMINTSLKQMRHMATVTTTPTPAAKDNKRDT